MIIFIVFSLSLYENVSSAKAKELFYLIVVLIELRTRLRME